MKKQRMLAMTISELAKEIIALGYLTMFAITHVITHPFRRMWRYLFLVLGKSGGTRRRSGEHLTVSAILARAKLANLINADVVVVSRHHERVCAGKLISYRYTPAGRFAITYVDYTTREREVICQDVAYFTIAPYDEALVLSFKKVSHDERHTLTPKESSVNWEDIDEATEAVKRARVSPCSQYLPSATIDGVVETMRRRAEARQTRNTPHT